MCNRLGKSAVRSLAIQGKWFLLSAVIIAQVQFPMPVAHDHSAVDSPLSLAAHVDQRHRGESEIEHGLHWHWVLPNQHESSHDHDDDSLPTPVALSGFGALASARTAVALPSFVIQRQSSICHFAFPVEIRVALDKRSTSDVTSISPTVHSCAVLRVIRC